LEQQLEFTRMKFVRKLQNDLLPTALTIISRVEYISSLFITTIYMMWCSIENIPKYPGEIFNNTNKRKYIYLMIYEFRWERKRINKIKTNKKMKKKKVHALVKFVVFRFSIAFFLTKIGNYVILMRLLRHFVVNKKRTCSPNFLVTSTKQ
jgi:hypothetical protein